MKHYMTFIITRLLLAIKPSTPLTYDLVIIGGGSAGLTAAKFAKQFDKTAVIIEKSKLGGDCTWTGCIPSKTLLSIAKKVHVTRDTIQNSNLLQTTKITRDGEEDDDSSNNSQEVLKVNMKVVRNQIKQTIQKIYDEEDSPEVLKNKFDVDTIKGKATFISPNELSISLDGMSDDNNRSTTTVKAKYGIIIATGAIPKKLPLIFNNQNQNNVEQLINYATYENIFDILEEVPNKITIVGGGPIGCEFAQAFSRFGSDVSLIATKLLPRNEPEVNTLMKQVFEDEGIKHIPGKLTNIQPLCSSSQNNGRHIATCKISKMENNKEYEVTVEGDLIILATGRKPSVHGMGLENIGIELKNDNNGGGIQVNDNLETNIEGVYAAGDCTGDQQFTHYAGYQGAIAARNILLPFTDPGVLTSSIPSTTFTSPEVASIGLNEEEAIKEFGLNKITSIYKSLENVDRAVCENATLGFLKIITKKNSNEILGATIVSPCAGEMISEIAVAMKDKKSLDDLATIMHPYPSYSFVFQVLGADLYYEKLSRYKFIFDILNKLGF